jgi:hypothetical protein
MRIDPGSTDLQHHVDEGGLLVLLPGVRLLRHLLRLSLRLHLDGVGFSLALQNDDIRKMKVVLSRDIFKFYTLVVKMKHVLVVYKNTFFQFQFFKLYYLVVFVLGLSCFSFFNSSNPCAFHNDPARPPIRPKVERFYYHQYLALLKCQLALSPCLPGFPIYYLNLFVLVECSLHIFFSSYKFYCDNAPVRH